MDNMDVRKLNRVFCKNINSWICVDESEISLVEMGTKTTTSSGYTVEPHTICRCTGLYDAENTLIFENDYVKLGNKEYLVIYNVADECFELLNYDLPMILSDYNDIVVVCGNVFSKKLGYPNF